MRSLLWPEGCRRSKSLRAGWIFTNKKVDYLSNHLCMAASSPYIWPDTVSQSEHMDPKKKNSIKKISQKIFQKVIQGVLFMAWRVPKSKSLWAGWIFTYKKVTIFSNQPLHFAGHCQSVRAHGSSNEKFDQKIEWIWVVFEVCHEVPFMGWRVPKIKEPVHCKYL